MSEQRGRRDRRLPKLSPLERKAADFARNLGLFVTSGDTPKSYWTIFDGTTGNAVATFDPVRNLVHLPSRASEPGEQVRSIFGALQVARKLAQQDKRILAIFGLQL